VIAAIVGTVGLVYETYLLAWLIRRDRHRQQVAHAQARLVELAILNPSSEAQPQPVRRRWHDDTQLAPGASRPGEPAWVRPYVKYMPWIEPGALPDRLRGQLIIAGTVAQALVAYRPAEQVTR